jgi:CheY-like chemotaxis protein
MSDQSRLPPRALVLEDEVLILMEVERVLADGGYTVWPVSSGEEALAVLNAQSFDVAVLDVGLRSGNSLAVADVLLKRGVPFLFSTGSKDTVPLEFATIPVIEKPFVEKDLLAAVASTLASR